MDIRPPRKLSSRPVAQAAPKLPDDIASSPTKPIEALRAVPAPPEPSVPSAAESPEPPDTSNEPPFELPQKRRHWWWLAGAGVIVALLMVTLSAWLWYQQGLQPVGGETRHIRVTIKSGLNAEQIGNLLAEKGVIRNSWIFQWYVRQHGKRDSLQAGEYVFATNQDLGSVVKMLGNGKTQAYNVTILPGKDLKQIKEGLVKEGFASEDIDKAFAKKYDHPLFADKPAEASLEGYIYPETFQVESYTTVDELLIRSFDEFYKQIQQENIVEQLKARNLTLFQGLTLASIVVMEVNTDEDRARAAQVFQKRLSVDMPLGSDVTFMYAARQMGVEPSVNLDSPYNTRIHKGLPPTPIANFSIGVLRHVANPAPTDYLYFVTGDDGTTHFTHTEAEHLEKARLYCHKLCEL